MPNEVHSLTLKVDSTQIKQGEKDLNSLANASGKAEGSTNKLSSSVGNATSSVLRYGTALTGLSLGALATGSVVAADTINRMDGRLKLATDSMTEFVAQQKELYQISIDARAPLQDITTLFIKLNPALKEMKVSTEAVNQVVETFAKGLKLGGATATESSSAILQFSQAMGSGVLRGEEFNSLMEASPYLMRKLAEGLDVPVGSLRKMAENGELTAGRVAAALLKMSSAVEDDFKQSYFGMSEAMVNFKTEAMLFAQELDKSIGFTSALSGAVKDASESLKSGKSAIGETITTLKEYESIIEGLATALVVMYGAQKAAAMWTTASTEVIKINSAAKASNLAITEAETLAQTMGAYATEARTIATNAATTGVINNRIATTAEIAALRAEALAAETSALAQTQHAYALRAAGVSAGFMGMALKAIPFVAVASTVAILATSFFDAKNDSDELNKSLDNTTESLNKLTKAQLEYRKTVLFDATQELAADLRAAEADARTKGIFQSEKDYQREKSDLADLKQKLEETREAYRLVRDFKPTTGKAEDKKDPKVQSLEETIKMLESQIASGKPKEEKKTEAQKEAEAEAERIKKLNEELNEFKKTNDREAILSTLNEEEQAYKKLEFVKEDQLEKFKGIKGSELEIQREFNLKKEELDKQANQKKLDIENEILNTIAQRQANAALTIYEASLQDSEKIKNKYAELIESLSGVAPELAKRATDQMNEELSKIEIDTFKIEFETEGLEGIPKAVSSISKAMSNLQKEDEKYQKNKKNFEKGTIEYQKNEEEHSEHQIAGYANLAGAAAGFFEEGSRGAEAMQVVSATLGIAQGIQAIISAWGSAPFPLNMPAVATTTAAVIPLIGQLTSMGGSGGSSGGGVGGAIADVQAQGARFDSETELITSRLDRQIELLEVIGRQGSVGKVEAQSLLQQYMRDIGSLSYKVAQDVVLAGKTEEWRRRAVGNLVTGASAATGLSLGSYGGNGGTAYLDTRVLAGNTEATLKYVAYLSENLSSIGFGGIDRFDREEVVSYINDALDAISDFATGAIEGVNNLKDASLDFQDAFDSITGTTFYETKRLNQAISDVDNLRGERSVAEYLQDQIDAISTINLTDSEIQTLLLQNVSALGDQEKILTRITNELGVAFAGGATEALDYIDSIELVAENMSSLADFNNEIVDFVKELRTDTIKSDTVGSFMVFSQSFNEMIDSIEAGAVDIKDIGGKAIDDARSYLQAIEDSADTKSRDIAFAKAVIANKFESVALTPDVSLLTVNDTLRFNHEALIIQQIKQNEKLNDIIRVLNESRDISNGILVSNQNIEAVS